MDKTGSSYIRYHRMAIYTAIMAALFFMYDFFLDPVFIIAAMTMAILAGMDIMAIGILSKKISARISVTEPIIRNGENTPVFIDVSNLSHIPSAAVFINMTCTNVLYNETYNLQAVYPLHAASKNTYETDASLSGLGEYIFTINSVMVRDILGFIDMYSGKGSQCRVLVLPDIEEGLYKLPASPGSTGTDQIELETPVPGHMMPQDLRDYKPGDRLRDINWKVSVRADHMVSIIRNEDTDKRYTVFLRLQKEKDATEKVLYTGYSILYGLISMSGPVQVIWTAGKNIMKASACGTGDLSDIYRTIYETADISDISPNTGSIPETNNLIEVTYEEDRTIVNSPVP